MTAIMNMRLIALQVNQGGDLVTKLIKDIQVYDTNLSSEGTRGKMLVRSVRALWTKENFHLGAFHS